MKWFEAQQWIDYKMVRGTAVLTQTNTALLDDVDNLYDIKATFHSLQSTS